MIFQFMKAHHGEFLIDRMARVLEVSRATFYRFLKAKPSARAIEDRRLSVEIVRIFHEQRRRGIRKVRGILRHRDDRVGKARINRLMRSRPIASGFQTSRSENEAGMGVSMCCARSFRSSRRGSWGPGTDEFVDVNHSRRLCLSSLNSSTMPGGFTGVSGSEARTNLRFSRPPEDLVSQKTGTGQFSATLP